MPILFFATLLLPWREMRLVASREVWNQLARGLEPRLQPVYNTIMNFVDMLHTGEKLNRFNNIITTG